MFNYERSRFNRGGGQTGVNHLVCIKIFTKNFIKTY